MSLAYRIIEDLYLTNRNFCSTDYDECLSYIMNELPGAEILNFKENINGWVIPPKHDVIEANIKKDGKLIYDATDNPIKFISITLPFEGIISLKELKEHLHYETYFDLPSDAIPFHFRQNYRPWERTWGFCVSKDFYDGLTEGSYEVTIKTKESDGYLSVLNYLKRGRSDQTFTFVAHLDHPGMANDDLAGVAVGIEFFKQLAEKETKFSYQLLLVQEILGSESYLQKLEEEGGHKIKDALFLEMLGSETQLALQHSFKGDSLMDKVLKNTLESIGVNFRTGPFHSIIGNDEICFEAHQIAMPSLSRFPYPQYHSSLDNLDIINKDCLNESVNILHQLVENLEKEILIKKNFSGLMCLGNPQYDLYVDWTASADARKLRDVMDLIHFVGDGTAVSELPTDLSQEVVLEYLRKWEEKGLIELI
ncbi:DUF4910 domain-containing protein [Roseivirga sp.]|uniref:DUF4910 domain-containing protein n=1 Tax=Roseivirga sp. TaxID=1964215 RepID=UPI003B523A3F